MPLYPYACEAGHATERVQSMKARHPKSIRCACGLRAKRVYGRFNLVRGALAFEPHFNPCLDAVVTSERHMKDVEARLAGEKGIIAQPYEPIHGRSSDWLAKGLAGHNASVRSQAETWERDPAPDENGLAEEVTA